MQYKINDFRVAIIFLVVGFMGIFATAIADSNDNMFIAGLFVALAITGLALSLVYLTKSWNNERKKDEEKQG